MNKKQKIMLGIICIIIIILVIIGLTYAYFVTKVEGNTTDTSVIMTSADLILIYGDENGTISANNIQPGDELSKKTFTVKNTGTLDIVNYGVFLEDVSNDFINNKDVVYSLTCTSSKFKNCNSIITQSLPNFNDLLVMNSIDKNEIQTYSLKVKYLETASNQSVDMNKSIKAKVQIYNMNDVVSITGKVSNYNDGDYIEIADNVSQINKDGYYKIIGIPTISTKLYLKDKNKNIKGEKNIEINRVSSISSINSNVINVNNYGKIINIDIESISNDININIKSIENYNKLLEGTLINKIFNNAILDNEINTKLVSNPNIDLGSISGNEKELIPSNDNYGVSYYYRGNVIDNFVNYHNMCWRIIRIEGDGSIKIILADKDNLCNSTSYSTTHLSSSLLETSTYGFDEKKSPNFVNSSTSSTYYKLNNWFNENFANDINKLKNDTWCLGNMDNRYSLTTYNVTNDTNFLYENALKIINKTPTLLCKSTSKRYKGYISLITTDEAVFAGLNDSSISNSYIINNATSNKWWTLNSRGYENGIGNSYIISNKKIDYENINNENYIRPVITLDARIYSDGTGLQSDPYIIK